MGRNDTRQRGRANAPKTIRRRSGMTGLDGRSAGALPGEARPGATPEPRGRRARPGGAGRERRASSSRSTTPAGCTGTCGSSTTACSPPGRCRAASRPTPERNHLAVRTEDHPLEYLEFHGEIPAGQYGAGTMKIWDRGTYEEHKFRDDEVMVTFHGERVRGRYVLFRTKGDDWMIHRMDPPEDPEREPMPEQLAPMLAAHRAAAAATTAAGRTRSSGTACARSRSSQGGRLTLQARSGRDITPRYPELRPIGRGARGARGDPRRRGRRVRRRAAELPEAPGPHAPGVRARGAAAGARGPGPLHRVRPALPRRPLAVELPLRRAPRSSSPSSSCRARPGRRPRTTSATAPRCSSSRAPSSSRA